jgi:hypothetical protein
MNGRLASHMAALGGLALLIAAHFAILNLLVGFVAATWFFLDWCLRHLGAAFGRPLERSWVFPTLALLEEAALILTFLLLYWSYLKEIRRISGGIQP